MNAGIRLAVAAICTVVLISIVARFTHAPIERANKAWIQKSLSQIVPVNLYDEQMVEKAFTFQHEALGSEVPVTIYPIVKGTQWNGAAVTVTAPNGYTGKIQLLVAILSNHSILGVRVLNHKETPGLGDDIELSKSAWITSFDNASLTTLPKYLWAVKKDGGAFDQFTGATITPRAVINAVYRVLHWHQSEGLAQLKQHYRQESAEDGV